jgi:hypothetical protein
MNHIIESRQQKQARALVEAQGFKHGKKEMGFLESEGRRSDSVAETHVLRDEGIDFEKGSHEVERRERVELPSYREAVKGP